MLWHGNNLRGFLHYAWQVLFDNTGTTLQNTNVEDVIKEVSSNLDNIDKGTYHIAIVMGTQAGSFIRGAYNFIKRSNYTVVINSAKEVSTTTELASNFAVSVTNGLALFYTNQVQLVGKLIDFNITVS